MAYLNNLMACLMTFEEFSAVIHYKTLLLSTFIPQYQWGFLINYISILLRALIIYAFKLLSQKNLNGIFKRNFKFLPNNYIFLLMEMFFVLMSLL